MVVKKSNLFKGFLSLLAIFFIITFLAACDKTIKVESISLDKEEIVLAVGDSETIVADVKPDNATDKTVSWSSEKPEIATVNDGVIEAVAVGETVITATAGEKTATVTVTVKEKYTVTFNSKGGSAVAPVQVMDGSKVTKPTDPTKLGYTFINWYSDDACENLYDFNVNVEANIILYAKWEDIKYTVTFNLDGGSEVSEQIVPYNGKAAEPAEDPIKEGHTFQGWFADAECETEFDFDAVIADDTVVYAKWQIKTFTVVFNTGGGTFIPGVEINYDSKVTRPEDPVKAEYIFRGWFKDSKHTEAFDFDQSITEDTTIFANWEFDTTNYCTLNFNVEGALFPITEIDDLMAAKPSITHELGVFNTGYMTYYKESIFLFKKGYAGNTWAREVGLARNADGLYEVIATVAAGTAISAEFKAAAEFILVGHDGYSAGFNFLNGLTVGQIITITGFDVLTAEDGKLDPKATVKVYPAGTKMQFSNVLLANDAKLPKPVKKNYAFAGWYGNADFTGE
ncbi:MAG: InlB B-repeat-containing protein, partial [Bacilli bacterium]|nr:InlB B-repeat-containing protein [Bacilli bacterium]